jgi:hypothetical protein
MFIEQFAILDSKGNLRRCGKDRYRSWWAKRGGSGSVRIKFKMLDEFLIETVFKGKAYSLNSDEPCFWHVLVTRPPNPSFAHGFMSALKKDLNQKCASKPETLAEVLKKGGTANILYEREFSAQADALNHHREAMNAIRAYQRTGRPEQAQILLADLSDWCNERWGRQTQVARVIDTSPQAVNDWLNGRKKMTAEQALRIVEFLRKERKKTKRSSDFVK